MIVYLLLTQILLAASSDVKRDQSRLSWWAPVREGSAVDIHSPLKKHKFQAKKPSRYTPGAGLVPAEAPVSVLAPSIVPGVSSVPQSTLSGTVRQRPQTDQQFQDHRKP